MARRNKLGGLLASAILSTGAPIAQAGDKLPIWELEDTDNRVLLMGSVHFLRDADYPLPEGMLEAYEIADALVMELDMDDLNPAVAQTLMTRLGLNQDGRTLEDIIGKEDYAATLARAEALSMPAAMLQQFEPWYAALMLTQLQMMALGFDPAQGIEANLLSQAQRDRKAITGLETMEEQLGMLDSLDTDTQSIFLMQSLEEADKIRENLDTMVAAWRNGNAEQMAEIYLEDMRAAPALFDALLVQRNRSWIDNIADLRNRDQNYLVVVGVLHLVGEDSVIAMLEDEGLSARQLSAKDFQ